MKPPSSTGTACATRHSGVEGRRVVGGAGAGHRRSGDRTEARAGVAPEPANLDGVHGSYPVGGRLLRYRLRRWGAALLKLAFLLSPSSFRLQAGGGSPDIRSSLRLSRRAHCSGGTRPTTFMDWAGLQPRSAALPAGSAVVNIFPGHRAAHLRHLRTLCAALLLLPILRSCNDAATSTLRPAPPADRTCPTDVRRRCHQGCRPRDSAHPTQFSHLAATSIEFKFDDARTVVPVVDGQCPHHGDL